MPQAAKRSSVRLLSDAVRKEAAAIDTFYSLTQAVPLARLVPGRRVDFARLEIPGENRLILGSGPMLKSPHARFPTKT
jgi:hypothetical protein